MHRALKVDRVKDKLAIDIWLRSCSGFLSVNKIYPQGLCFFNSQHLFSLFQVPSTILFTILNLLILERVGAIKNDLVKQYPRCYCGSNQR